MPAEFSIDIVSLHSREARKVCEPLTLEEEIELGKRIEAGDVEARNQLVLANLDVAMVIARRYAQSRGEYLDLVQEGYLGLFAATKQYDWREGVKFATYASYSVRGMVNRGRSTLVHTVRLPRSAQEALYHLNCLLEEHPDAVLTPESITESTGDSVQTVKAVLDYVAYVMPVSLDTPTDDEGRLLRPEVADNPQCRPEQLVMRRAAAQRLCSMVDELPVVHAAMLKLQFGLNGEEAASIEVVARLFGITESQVTRRRRAALQVLRDKFADELADLFHG